MTTDPATLRPKEPARDCLLPFQLANAATMDSAKPRRPRRSCSDSSIGWSAEKDEARSFRCGCDSKFSFERLVEDGGHEGVKFGSGFELKFL